jgi:poly-gamma-glutamate synthesis protein (capsule biosynthesis protein)
MTGMVPRRDAGEITLFLCGDVMTGRGIDQVLPHPGDPYLAEPVVDSAGFYVELAEEANGPIRRPVDFAYIWGDALPALEEARPDIRIVNLETSITESRECLPKGINYKMHPANTPCLSAAAIDCCVLANNHTIDWGYQGLVDTLDALARASIATAGAGRDAAEAAAPAIKAVPQGRVLVFGFGSPSSGIPRDWAAGPGKPGVSLLEDLSSRSVERVAAAVAAARRPGDVAVASIHWGGNWGHDIPAEQRRFAHALLDGAGIDIVHGHSSHHAKAFEVHRGKLVLYGCGDFINDYEGISGYEQFRDDLVLMYLATVGHETGRLARLEMVPFQIRNFRLRRATRADAAWLAGVLNREGKRFGTRVGIGDSGSLILLAE